MAILLITPRPRRRERARRPRRGDVRGPGRRGGHARGAARARRAIPTRSGCSRRSRRARGAASRSRRSRAWCRRRASGRGLPLPHALPRAFEPCPAIESRADARCRRRTRLLPRGRTRGAGVTVSQRRGAAARRGAAHLVPDPQGRVPAHGRPRARGRRRRSRGIRRRDARAGRRVGLRQDDGRPLAAAARRADRRRRLVRRRRPARALARGAAPLSPRDPDRVPGSGSRSLDPRMRVRDAIAEGMETFAIGANDRERTERVAALLARVQLDPARDVALPARVLGRPAPAHLHRARARGRAAAARLRRGDLRARRLDPGADPEPAPATSRRSSASPISSSRTISASCAISPTASR